MSNIIDLLSFENYIIKHVIVYNENNPSFFSGKFIFPSNMPDDAIERFYPIILEAGNSFFECLQAPVEKVIEERLAESYNTWVQNYLKK